MVVWCDGLVVVVWWSGGGRVVVWGCFEASGPG